MGPDIVAKGRTERSPPLVNLLNAHKASAKGTPARFAQTRLRA